ncbi:MAG: hypothetical protein LKH04_10395 [Lachnospiraceae bacterium]|jgi:uncharacterized membrane protein (DUF106 family)|nr:hypothetical protein [Lachnospiraceae bacterium]MCI1398881.1 hypothetical protein [Lachnospiraceae bacterium]MCI1424674.1 hypothetical protein [Lachnospiraceae bacterium]MCI1453415.1 hypothetical protein [Lachnospiraceae bacterium]MDD5848432.1 hypothetical protein [Bacillota bacterium]
MAEKKVTEAQMQEMVKRAQELKKLGDEDKLKKLEEAAADFSSLDVEAFTKELSKIAGEKKD